MPKPGTRHRDSKSRTYKDFRGGGLNLAASERLLGEKDFASCKNAIYERNGGRLRTLEPLELVVTAAASITSIFYSSIMGFFYGISTHIIYKVTGNTATSIGALSGTAIPAYCDWGDEAGRKLYLASGSILQYYNGTTLATQTPVPVDEALPSGDKWNTANDVMVREGRILINREGKDRVVYSGIRDPENWQFVNIEIGEDDYDVHTASDAQYAEIGEEQGGDIIKVVPISRDIVIFRTNGGLYRMTGSFPDWVSVQIADQVSPVNRNCIVTLGNDVMFLDQDRGLRKVSAVEAYNYLKVEETEGEKVNAWLSEHITTDARLWVLPDRCELWIKPNSGNTVLIYSSRYQGWTSLDLGTPVTAVAEAAGEVYLALGTKLCKLNDAATTVYLEPAMTIPFAPYFSKDTAHVMEKTCIVDKDTGAVAKVTFLLDGEDTYEWVLSDGENDNRQVLSSKEVRPVLTSTGGTVVLDELSLNIAEVI